MWSLFKGTNSTKSRNPKTEASWCEVTDPGNSKPCGSPEANLVAFTDDGGGGDSIQEYTAANPYYPPQKKTFGVRIRVSTHAQRSPPVRRHRRLILPNQSRVTARARSRTGNRVSTRLAGMLLRHFSKVPVSPFVVITHPGTTRECINDRPLPCRSVAQVQRGFRRRLPQLLLRPLSLSTAFESRD